MGRRAVGRIAVTADLNAPPPQVWSMLCNPNRLLEWNTELADVRDATPTLDYAGASYTQVWRILGRERLGRMEIVEVEPERGRQVRGTLPIGAAFSGRETIEPTEQGTRLSVSLEYEIPWGRVGRLFHPVARRFTERMFAKNARNLDGLLAKER